MRHIYKYFEEVKRPNGSEFVKLVDDAPAYIKDFMWELHLEFECNFPNDWIYSVAHEAFYDMCCEGLDVDDCNIEADVYYSDLYRWMSDNRFASWCVDEAVVEGLVDASAGVDERIGAGQYFAKSRIYRCVADFLGDYQRECEEEAEAEQEPQEASC